MATNLSTIGSFYYHRITELKSAEEGKGEQSNIPGEQRTRFFRDELNLDADKIDQFREINRTFNRTAREIETKMGLIRLQIVEELGRESSDKNQLDSLSIEIGNLHTELKRVTNTFYLEMKDICTPDQEAKLNTLFQSMLNNENQINLPNPGNQGGRWRKQ
jgi:Spy/CpxP family protein refolding chaperone